MNIVERSKVSEWTQKLLVANDEILMKYREIAVNKRYASQVLNEISSRRNGKARMSYIDLENSVAWSAGYNAIEE